MNIQKMVKQAQQQMEKIQEQMSQLVVEGSSGGGMVTITMKGTKEVTGIKIDPEALTAKDVEMLQDLILAAINDATRKVDEALNTQLGPLAQGFKGLPGF